MRQALGVRLFERWGRGCVVDLMEVRSFAESGADAADFIAHEAHGHHAKTRGALEDFRDFGAGDEAQFRIFADACGEAVVAGESGGKAGDFARAKGARRVNRMVAIHGHGDFASADDEDTGERVAAVKECGTFAERDPGCKAVQFGA